MRNTCIHPLPNEPIIFGKDQKKKKKKERERKQKYIGGGEIQTNISKYNYVSERIEILNDPRNRLVS